LGEKYIDKGDCLPKHDAKAKAISELMLLEAEFAREHKRDTDDELIQYIRDTAKKLGHVPSKHEVRGYALIKSRLGPWPRVLEIAGLKKY
jgi:hypothetical protein